MKLNEVWQEVALARGVEVVQGTSLYNPVVEQFDELIPTLEKVLLQMVDQLGVEHDFLRRVLRLKVVMPLGVSQVEYVSYH